MFYVKKAAKIVACVSIKTTKIMMISFRVPGRAYLSNFMERFSFLIWGQFKFIIFLNVILIFFSSAR